MKRILVLGGMHGNELLGIKLAALLKEKPITGVDGLIANPRAVKAGARFTESDLSRSFGNDFPGTYETCRATKLKEAAAQYDIVLDIHNTMTPNNNASFIGASANQELLAVSATLGLKNCIKATYDCINKYCPNALSVEISIGDKLDDAYYWYKMLLSLVDGAFTAQPDVVIYTYLQRVTWQQAGELNATEWRPFKPVPAIDCRRMGVVPPVYPIFIGSRLTEYYATLLTKAEK